MDQTFNQGQFSAINGQVQAVWMGGACRNLLGELRLSCQHRLPYQFPAGYDFLTSPQLVAEASRQAGNTATGTYTAARVRTTAPRPRIRG